MSGSQTEVVTRRSRADRQDNDGDGGQQAASVVVEQPAEVSPEDALAEARRQVQESQRQTADARRQAREAQQHARQAQSQVHEATVARHGDREVVVTSIVEAAKSEINAAKHAYRLAREAGDVDAEIAAQEAMGMASAKLTNATGELERIKAQPKPREQPQNQDGPRMSPEAQAWVDSHPEYAEGGRYTRMAGVLHGEAIAAGHKEGSQSYVDFIDSGLTDEYGEGHGQGGSKQVQGQDRGGRRQSQPAARGGDGLPPSRSGGGGQGGWKSVPTDLGEIQFQQRADGTRAIRFANADTHANFVEGAQTSFRATYEKDPGRALADYAEEHIQEFLEGGGTIRHGDGRIMR